MDKKYYQITVVGAPRADDPNEMKYMRDANMPAGFSFNGNNKDKRSFFHLELTEITGNTVTLNGRQMSIPNPQAKPFTFNCFERSHPELFRAVLKEIKANTADKATYEKDLGDKSKQRIILNGLAAPGAIVAFKLPYEVYRMNRNPQTHKLVQFKAQRYAEDGSIETIPVTTTVGETFLYGNECEAVDVYIDRAIKAVLKASKKVETQTVFEHAGGATENTSIEEGTETAEGTTSEKGDDGDI